MTPTCAFHKQQKCISSSGYFRLFGQLLVRLMWSLLLTYNVVEREIVLGEVELSLLSIPCA
jgi:hypothetical protein